MGRGSRWGWAVLAALVLLGGTAEPVLRQEAANRARAAAVGRAVAAPAAVNRLPEAVPATQAAPPSPSGAHAPYPVNHTFDAARTFPGSPPDNHGFETAPYAVGTPPPNHDLQAAPIDVGAPPTNHDFASGDLTGWTMSGTVALHSDPEHGFYATLGTHNASGSVISEAVTLDATAQTIAAEVFFLSTTGTSGVEVYVLSGAGYATSTRVAQVFCSACGSWQTIDGAVAAWQGQSIKVKLSWWLGAVGVDAIRPRVLFAGQAVAGGGVARVVEGGGEVFARLSGGGVLTSGAFTVPSDAQYLAIDLKGLTTANDQFYFDVLHGTTFGQSTRIPVVLVGDAWETVKATAVGWRGQQIKVRITHAYGAVGVDDLGVQSVDFPGWEVTDVVQRRTGGPTGAYAETRSALTTAPFALDPAAQQLTLRSRQGSSSGASFYVELLTGPSFATVVQLSYELADPNQWQTRAYGVAPYAGQTVKLRIRPNLSTVLLDAVAIPEAVVPGWTPTSTNALATGEDAAGTYVTPYVAGGALFLDSSLVSPGIVDGGGADWRFYNVTYDIGYQTGSQVVVYWTNAATGQDWQLFGDAANSPTGVRSRWFWLPDFGGVSGVFTVKVTGGGKLYQLAENVARQHQAEPFSRKAGVGVDATTGAFGTGAVDLRLHDALLPVAFARAYHGHSDRVGPLGYRWSHTFETRLVITEDGDAGVVFGAGKEEFFVDTAFSGQPPVYAPADPRVNSTLTKNADGSYAYRTPDNLTYHFMASGQLSHVEDLRENRITVTRDAQDRVDLVTDPGGRTLDFGYDANGRLASVTDPEGATVSYGYDAAGDLVGVTDPAGGVTAYAYDRRRLVSITDPNGEVTLTVALDAVNRVVEQTDALGHETAFAYGVPGQGATRVSDPNGHATDYHFDFHGRTTAIQDAEGNVTDFVFDAEGNLEKIVDPAGQETDAVFDAGGFPTTVTDPLGNPVSIAYNPLHLPTQVTDGRGKVWLYSYDADGNRLTATDPRGVVATWTYDAFGNVLTETVDAGTPPHLNLTTTHTYDAAGNRITTTDPLNHTWTWTYDGAGRVLTATDPNDRTTTYGYDPFGRLELVRNARGDDTEIVYDLAGQLLGVVDPLGHVWSWTYDDAGRVATKTDPAAAVWTYGWDAAGNLTSVTDPLSHATTYEYDDANRLTAVIDAEGGRTAYAYDLAGRIAAVTDPVGRATGYAYDANGRLTGLTLANGGVFTFAYDANGNPTAVTDPLLRATTYAYDEANRLIAATDPLTHATTYGYDDAGRRTSVTNALSQVWSYGYDGASRLTSATDPLSHATTYGYDPAGNLTAVTDALGQTWTYGYDALDRLVSVTDPLVHEWTWSFDEAGRRTVSTLPTGRTTTYAYDARDLLTGVTVDPNPAGQTGHLALTTSFAYDDAGRLIAEANPRGHDTEYAYDDADRMISITDALGGVVGFGRDAAGQVLSVTNPRGKVTAYTYDPLGNVLSETDPLGRTRTATYDLLGRLDTATDGRGIVSAHGYDVRGDLTSIVARDGQGTILETVGFGYDALRRVTQMSDASGATTWVFDAAGRVTAVGAPQGTIGYGYDAADRRTSLTLPGNRTTTYGYDGAGRLTSVGDWQSVTTTLGYDADGRRTSVLRPNGVSTAYSYDGAGRLGLVEHADGPTMLQRFVYTLDANGNRTNVLHNGGTETYTLDALDRITRAVYPNGDAVDYAYDPNGNRTTLTVNGAVAGAYTYDDADQLLADGSIAYVYDANGNLTQAGADTFAWDWADRLTGVTAGGQATTYAYAGDGVRTSRTSGGQTTGYLWDRLDPSGLPMLADDGTQAYLHAGEVLAGIDSATGIATYPLADGLGSVRGRTDDAGALIGTADYDVFGTVRGSTGVGGTFGFAGEQRDNATGLVHLRARDYAPGLGRFLSRDPVQPSAAGTQGWQPYAYAGNNPATFVDPSGAAFAMSADFAVQLTGGAITGLSLTGRLAGTGPVLTVVAAHPVFWIALLVLIFATLLYTFDVQDFCQRFDRCGELTGTIRGWMEGGVDVGRSWLAIGVTAAVLACQAVGTGLGDLPARAVADACPTPPDDCLEGAAREVVEEVLAGGYAVDPPVGDPEEFFAAAGNVGTAAAVGCAGGTDPEVGRGDRGCMQGVGSGSDDPIGRPTDFQGQDRRESTEVVKRAARDAGLNEEGRKALHNEYRDVPDVSYNDARARAEELYEENAKFRGKKRGDKEPHWSSERDRRGGGGGC